MLTLWLSAVPEGYAQSSYAGEKVIGLALVDGPPLLDGKLDDPAWESAAVIDELHEVNPDEFAVPSERSRIYVVLTKDALYVAGRFWDSEPDKVSAQVLRQGDYSFGDDSFSVMIDPFNNGRSGYTFDLTPNSVRSEMVFANVSEENWDWRGIWHGVARKDAEGWVAEIEIPFKTLSFDPANTEWGLNFARYIGRKSEHIGWVSSNRVQNPAVFGRMTGVSGIEQGAGLDVVAGVVAGRSEDYLVASSSTLTEPTLDVFYKFTPGLTGALTVNTDFSGTGADQRQINLTRFGLFFPEQRTFFLQDADIFEFGRITGGGFFSRSTLSKVDLESGRPFFSRRIGLSDSGEALDIDLGVKVTGRIGRADIGVLGVSQDGFIRAGPDGETEVVKPGELFVARLAANVLTESSVGMILTSGDPNSNHDNTVTGLDFRYLNTRLAGGRTIEGGLWYQQSDTQGLDGDDAAWGFTLRAPNAEGFRGAIGFKELQSNFSPALGFVNRAGVQDMTVELGHTWYPEAGALRTIHSGFDFQRVDTTSGDLQSQILTLRPLELENQFSDNVQFHYHLMKEQLLEGFEISEGVNIPAGSYQFNQYCVNAVSGEFRAVSAEGYYCDGDFFDGSQRSTGISVMWRPSPHFRFSGGYDFDDIALPGGAFITRLVSLRADIAMTSTFYWENLLQYDNVSHSLGLNSILRWIPQAGREVVLVVNREYQDFTRNRNFDRVTGDVRFKFAYTFRF